ncbi:MAG: chemotaxis protein CheW [Acidobacteriota bacterium]
MDQSSTSKDQIDKALVVRCGSEFFLLDVARVRRVIDKTTIHPSPFSVLGLSGLARFGGGPLAVFSLEALAVAQPSVRPVGMTVVVIDIGGSNPAQRLGLAVDEVLEIVSLHEEYPDMAHDCVVSRPLDIDGRQARLFNVDALGAQGSIDRCPGVNQIKECI